MKRRLDMWRHPTRTVAELGLTGGTPSCLQFTRPDSGSLGRLCRVQEQQSGVEASAAHSMATSREQGAGEGGGPSIDSRLLHRAPGHRSEPFEIDLARVPTRKTSERTCLRIASPRPRDRRSARDHVDTGSHDSSTGLLAGWCVARRPLRSVTLDLERSRPYREASESEGRPLGTLHGHRLSPIRPIPRRRRATTRP